MQFLVNFQYIAFWSGVGGLDLGQLTIHQSCLRGGAGNCLRLIDRSYYKPFLSWSDAKKVQKPQKLPWGYLIFSVNDLFEVNLLAIGQSFRTMTSSWGHFITTILAVIAFHPPSLAFCFPCSCATGAERSIRADPPGVGRCGCGWVPGQQRYSADRVVAGGQTGGSAQPHHSRRQQ